MKAYRFLTPLTVFVTLTLPALAAAPSPAGVWRTIDDNSNKVRSLVRIVEVNGELQGIVEKTFPAPGEDPAPVCKKCEGDRHDKPVIGMTIMWGMKKDGNEWAGGTILDPDNGKTYRCKLTLADDGKSVNVRGFIGLSLFGRTQTWHRQE